MIDEFGENEFDEFDEQDEVEEGEWWLDEELCRNDETLNSELL